MSVIMDVADALVTLLNAHDFSLEFTTERHYLLAFKLEDLKPLQVAVISAGQNIATASRSDHDFDFAVDIGVQKKVDPSARAELDALTDLVEEIINYVRGTALPPELGMSLLSIANEPVYDHVHLDEKHVFTSLLTVTYTSCR